MNPTPKAPKSRDLQRRLQEIEGNILCEDTYPADRIDVAMMLRYIRSLENLEETPKDEIDLAISMEGNTTRTERIEKIRWAFRVRDHQIKTLESEHKAMKEAHQEIESGERSFTYISVGGDKIHVVNPRWEPNSPQEVSRKVLSSLTL